MGFNKVVARFKDGSLVKGTTSDFSPLKSFFHLELAGGERIKVEIEKLKVVEIDVSELKAAFFVKDFDGDKDRQDKYEDEIPGSGKKVEVKFNDGEVVVGFAMSYSTDRVGFFFTPADIAGNNERIFVVKSATEKITFL